VPFSPSSGTVLVKGELAKSDHFAMLISGTGVSLLLLKLFDTVINIIMSCAVVNGLVVLRVSPIIEVGTRMTSRSVSSAVLF